MPILVLASNLHPDDIYAAKVEGNEVRKDRVRHIHKRFRVVNLERLDEPFDSDNEEEDYEILH